MLWILASIIHGVYTYLGFGIDFDKNIFNL